MFMPSGQGRPCKRLYFPVLRVTGRRFLARDVRPDVRGKVPCEILSRQALEVIHVPRSFRNFDCDYVEVAVGKSEFWEARGNVSGRQRLWFRLRIRTLQKFVRV